MDITSLLAGFRPLTDVERRLLVRIATDSIGAAVRGEVAAAVSDLTPALRAPGAAFVSLHCGRSLRGCIGTLAVDAPLHETVARVARSAALNDPRFAPLQPAEVDSIEIEISRLSPPVPVRPEQIVLGRHGVTVRQGDHSAVFLPQVAPLHGWDRETLLNELCQKAGLPTAAWRWPEIVLAAFTAEVFGKA